LMAGAQIGSVVHDTAPNAVLVLGLCGVLFDSGRKCVRSARRIQQREASQGPLPVEASPRAVSVITDFGRLASLETAGAGREMRLMPTPDERNRACAEPISQNRVRRAQIKLMVAWAICMTVVCAKGVVFELCSLWWWLLTIMGFLFLASFGLHFAFQLKSRTGDQVDSINYKELAVPVVVRSLFAGMLAAICGIGGGMVMGPLLVELKVEPAISSATTATTLLLLSSSTGFVFLVRDVAPHDYAPFFCVVTALGAFTGKLVIGRWVERTGKQSVIVWCLAFITALSVLLMGGLGVFTAWETGMETLKFRNFCPHQPA